MKGSAYPTALQHLFVGLYIAELCLIGLFATQLNNPKVSGPFALMIILVVVTGLYHTALNASLTPLMRYLPKTLEAEEHNTHVEEPRKDEISDNIQPHSNGVTGTIVEDQNVVEPDKAGATTTATAEVATLESKTGRPRKSGNPRTLTRFFKPHVYDDYAAMRRIVPAIDLPDDPSANEDLARDAYLPPAVWTELPHLLIPRDVMGISARECRETGKVLPCSDDAATLDERNRIVVNERVMEEVWFAEKERRIMKY